MSPRRRTTRSRLATQDEAAALLEFMASFEPVKLAPNMPATMAHHCECGNQVARSGAQCIRCANTARQADGHAQDPDVRRNKRSGT